ncbi:transcriptional regulator [Actinoplanes sp. ATCC 53533]|uniref:DUF5753 domain-containing protein n=1 Tax=Actinoplanes sp. ATCC 53533 TaxID=1288362 RepID=UPI000F773E2C|nr:DUF5753 domain-containing protein [Actinoplanes sp. ATCC 53533]RSM51301.1 transcriptional regulator [Actinoplanes sp. ATCC 53533]
MSAPTGPAVARDRLLAPLRELRDSLRLSSDHLDRDRDWWGAHRFTIEYPRFVEHEARATQIGVCQPLVVPGILQTPSYALAATAAITGRAPDDPAVLARVEVRLSRQHSLLDRMAGGDPPHLTVVLDEIVLRRPVGGADVLRDQLDELLELGRLDAVTIVVRPTEDGAHAGLGGYFELLRFPDGNADVVFLEATATDNLLTEPEATAPYSASLGRLLSGANGKDAVLDAIRRIRDSPT